MSCAACSASCIFWVNLSIRILENNQPDAVVIPSEARTLTVEALSTLAKLLDQRAFGRSFAALTMSAESERVRKRANQYGNPWVAYNSLSEESFDTNASPTLTVGRGRRIEVSESQHARGFASGSVSPLHHRERHLRHRNLDASDGARLRDEHADEQSALSW